MRPYHCVKLTQCQKDGRVWLHASKGTHSTYLAPPWCRRRHSAPAESPCRNALGITGPASLRSPRSLDRGLGGHPTPVMRPDARRARHRERSLDRRGRMCTRKHSETHADTRGHDVASFGSCSRASAPGTRCKAPFVRQFGLLGFRTRTTPRAGEVAVQLGALTEAVRVRVQC